MHEACAVDINFNLSFDICVITLVIQVKTQILPQSLLGKILSVVLFDGKAIEGHFAKIVPVFNFFNEEYDEYEVDLIPRLSYKNIDKSSSWEGYKGFKIKREKDFTINPFFSTVFETAGLATYQITFHKVPAYMVNMIDDNGLGLGKIDSSTYRYTKIIRIYSLQDLIIFFLTLISAVGAFFEILTFFIK